MFRKMSFFIRIFLCLALVITVAITVPAYFFSKTMQTDLFAETEKQAYEKLELLSLFYEPENLFSLTDTEYTPNQKEGYTALEAELKDLNLRLTLIQKNGTVLYDSGVKTDDIDDMDNHADRIEFIVAIEEGHGSSSRYSNTVKTNFIYVAKRLSNGDVLRLAFPFDSYEERMEKIKSTVYSIFAVAMFFAFLIAFALSYGIKKQIKTMLDVVDAISLGKYESRLHYLPGKEFAVLANAVNRMAINIENQLGIMRNQSAQLKTIFNTMQDGILLLDSRGNVRHSNKALRQLTPSIPDQDVMPIAINAQVVEFISSPMLQNAVDYILKVEDPTQELDTKNCPSLIQTSPLNYYLELELFTNRTFAVYLAKPVKPTTQIGLVIVIHEITDMMRLENVRKDFVANVSHELRTPLTSIQGYAETLASMPELSEDCTRFAQKIYKHGSYLNNMIEDLLSLARIENTKDDYPMSLVNPKQAIETAHHFCEPACKKNNVSLEISIDNDIQVRANLSDLERVFRNLLENACRYALPNSTIRIFSEKMHTQLQITVENTGVFIAEENVERIFERFYRVEKNRTSCIRENGATEHNTDKNQQSATGLGLAICKHIIERHGGKIWAKSTKHQEGNEPYGITQLIFTLSLAKSEK